MVPTSKKNFLELTVSVVRICLDETVVVITHDGCWLKSISQEIKPHRLNYVNSSWIILAKASRSMFGCFVSQHTVREWTLVYLRKVSLSYLRQPLPAFPFHIDLGESSFVSSCAACATDSYRNGISPCIGRSRGRESHIPRESGGRTS